MEQLVFNELSLNNGDIVDENICKQKIEQFIKLYSSAQNKRFDASVITYNDFKYIQINPDYNVAQWRNDNTIDSDLKRVFLNMCDKQEILLCEDIDEEVYYNNDTGQGLLYAYKNDNCCISFTFNSVWDTHTLSCVYHDLENKCTKNIKNISKEEHFQNHQEFIQQCLNDTINKIQTTQHLLDNLSSLFPSLIFHPKAIDQIKNDIEKTHVKPIRTQLCKLEKYCLNWNSGVFQPENIGTKCSPQSQQTLSTHKGEHTFYIDNIKKNTGKLACSIYRKH